MKFDESFKWTLVKTSDELWWKLQTNYSGSFQWILKMNFGKSFLNVEVSNKKHEISMKNMINNHKIYLSQFYITAPLTLAKNIIILRDSLETKCL